MKMIGHQAPGQYISKWQNMMSDFSKKVIIVFLGEKYLLPVVTLVVNVVNSGFFEMHSFSINLLY
jgi:hypothetical protein